jgi:HK97 family phage portal protein
MGLLDLFRKRQDSPDRYESATVSITDRGDRPKSTPFSYLSATRACSSWVYAAASLNAQAVASVPLRLYVRSKPSAKRLFHTRPVPAARKKYLRGDLAVHPSMSVVTKSMAGEFEEVSYDHPICTLLRRANSIDDGFGLAVSRIMFLELTGNAYLHPVFDRALNIPVELWTMPAHQVKIVPSTDGIVGRYVYGVDAQNELEFERDEVIHFKRPNPRSPYYGLGKCEAAWGVIQQNEAVHTMDLSFFENMSRPDYAAIIKGGAGREQLERFETKMREMLQGSKRAGRMVAITGDVELKPLNFPTKDLGGRDEIVEEIAAVFGIPVSMLKANDPNLASAKAGYAWWREATIAPICRLDEETLNAKLLPMFGIEEDAYLAYDNPVPADRQQDLVERQTAVAGGWMTPNEARLESGYDPIEEETADRLYVNGQPLGGAPSAGLALPFGRLPQPQQPEEPPEEVEAPEGEPEPAKGYKALPFIKPLDAGGEDCVSNNIRTLLDEGYDREQAIAIAISVCDGKAWSEADPTKAIADVDLKPTEEMADLAARGLALRREYGRGGTEIGVARARDISNRKDLSPDTVRRMSSFFARHRVDLDAEGAQPGEDGYPSAGAVAWLLWGGNPSDADGAGAAWAKRKSEELDRAAEKRVTQEAIAEYVSTIDRKDGDLDRKAIDRLLLSVTKAIDPAARTNAKMIDYLLSDEDIK